VQPLEQKLAEISLLSKESLTVFLSAWKSWSVPKDYYLVREHTVADYIFFIQTGLARIYYHKKGKDITEWIAPDGTFFLSITSFFERKPGKLIIQTLEPSEVMGIHYNDFHKLAAAHHDIETLYRKMLAFSLILSQERMESIQFETAEQRYKRLITKNPNFLQRVPLTYIASFLGVTLETLSRIRAAANSPESSPKKVYKM
jgi:CRP-like cAMP-binding protein